MRAAVAILLIALGGAACTAPPTSGDPGQCVWLSNPSAAANLRSQGHSTDYRSGTWFIDGTAVGRATAEDEPYLACTPDPALHTDLMRAEFAL